MSLVVSCCGLCTIKQCFVMFFILFMCGIFSYTCAIVELGVTNLLFSEVVLKVLCFHVGKWNLVLTLR